MALKINKFNGWAAPNEATVEIEFMPLRMAKTLLEDLDVLIDHGEAEDDTIDFRDALADALKK